jgi:hypothetical protein
MNWNDWNFLLNSDSTDYAANLILYDIHNKDALIMTQIMSQTNRIEFWRKYRKNEDLKFWENDIRKKDQKK